MCAYIADVCAEVAEVSEDYKHIKYMEDMDDSKLDCFNVCRSGISAQVTGLQQLDLQIQIYIVFKFLPQIWGRNLKTIPAAECWAREPSAQSLKSCIVRLARYSQ